jgi:hypothetical protein
MNNESNNKECHINWLIVATMNNAIFERGDE